MSDPFRVGPELHTVPGALPPAIHVLPLQGNENEAATSAGEKRHDFYAALRQAQGRKRSGTVGSFRVLWRIKAHGIKIMPWLPGARGSDFFSANLCVLCGSFFL